MSKLNQIEQKLSELDGATFQKLGDAFLYKKGYTFFNAIGSVVGENKTKTGTPDTLISLDNGQYVFVEYTTTKNNIYKKFDDDLDKCFDEGKTGIYIEKIDEVILFYNAKMTSSEEEKLRQKCIDHGIGCSIFNLNTISLSLLHDYPGIARDFLSVDVDTGQILDIDDFIKQYEQNALSTPLHTRFLYRENELSNILESINASAITVITGQAGVGKTRLALQSCIKYVETNPEVELKCVYYNGRNLFDELRDYFSKSQQYIIFVDDANRNTNLSYILELLHNEQNIKVVLTVRNYAISKIERTLEQYDRVSYRNIEVFSKDEIKNLVKEEYKINNPDYLERISNIAEGNPRIAFMTAKIAKEENSLDSIRNIENVYDMYFKTIKDDVTGLDDDILKVACIVVFFRAVDRSNREMMELIAETFQISEDAFWKAVGSLHDIEVFDLYEDDIVKVSDQVLATYLFFLGVFKEKKIEFSLFMDNFFLTHKERIKDTLYPVLNAFDEKSLIEDIKPVVTRLFHEAEDEVKSDVASTFYFVLPTETLLFLKQQINGLPQQEMDITKLDFNIDFNGFSISNIYLKVLSFFSYADQQNYEIALDLLLKYIETQPSEIQTVLYLCTHSFGYNIQSSYLYETLLMEKILTRANGGKNELYSRIFIAISNYFLKTEFDTTQTHGREVQFTYYTLKTTDKLRKLRSLIWKNLFDLYKIDLYKFEILQVLYQYSHNHTYRFNETEIIKIDTDDVIDFIRLRLNSREYDHCVIAQSIFKFYQTKDISVAEELIDRYKNETYLVAELVFEDERKSLEMDWKVYEMYHKEQIHSYIHGLDYSALLLLLDHIEKIQSSHFNIDQRDYLFDQNVLTIFESLYDKDLDLFLSVINIYLNQGNSLDIKAYSLIGKLIIDIGYDDTYALLSRYNYRHKNKWLFDCLMQIPSEYISIETSNILLELYAVAEANEIPYKLEFLKAYYIIDKDIYLKVVRLVTRRASVSKNFIHGLRHLFDGKHELGTILNNDFNLIEHTYFLLDQYGQSFDYNGEVFNQLLENDLFFINRYLDYKFSDKKVLSKYDENRSFAFLWKRDDVNTIMDMIIQYIVDEKIDFFHFDYLSVFFRKPHDNSIDILEVDSIQKEYLLNFIQNNYLDTAKTEYIFNFIAGLSLKDRKVFILEFLRLNQNYNDFEKIPIVAHSNSWTGSAVPMYQRKKDNLLDLLNEIHGADYLEHRKRIENYIKYLDRQIEDEKKKDFLQE